MFFSLVLLSIALIGCSNQDDTNQSEDLPVSVQVKNVTKDTLTIQKSIYGKTAPESSIPVMAPVAAEVTEVHVDKGESVEEGDALITISSPSSGAMDIEASADGQITTFNATEGGFVSNTEPFATISNIGDIHIQAAVTTENRQLFEGLENITVIINEKDQTATIDYVSKVPNQQTGLYDIEATLEDPEESILPGMTAILRVTKEEIADSLVIPTEALVEEGGSNFVYVIKDYKAIETKVNVLRSLTEQTAVEGDMKEGDQVVTKGQLVLSDGKEVTIQEEEEAS
ncbi:efflux RND transporter periplasmic adaptor subunit [Radiobacillus kanasensis]|uniref:efflux RND transporter periplasmic adaptor subunit n=1 Tax=Radiobacillus kanasensis TaxID=2844358 RepID=UPI001E32C5D5|nr:efflux RND transporter periplasmic adaptor subunit [Radiobacillus kanasensis]UFU01437.1 efflux RND transporter periplasmic adaptor subunit [Radiobacillus kanasensis]